MSKNKKRIPEGNRAAFGLSNSSDFVSGPLGNEEEARLEAVEKIHAINDIDATHMFVHEFQSKDIFKVETKIEIMNVRKAPSMRAEVLFVAKKGDIFATDSLIGDWLSVRAPEGHPTWGEGFVVAKFVKEVDDGQHS